MRGIDFLRLAFVARQAQHGEGDLILILRRQPTDGFKGLIR